jgi:hypothetical protein
MVNKPGRKLNGSTVIFVELFCQMVITLQYEILTRREYDALNTEMKM